MEFLATFSSACSGNFVCQVGAATIAVLVLGAAALFFIPFNAPQVLDAPPAPLTRPYSLLERSVIAAVFGAFCLLVAYHYWG